MSREADHFRKQAERAERLARSVLDDQASKQLVEASKEFRRKAEQLQERPDKELSQQTSRGSVFHPTGRPDQRTLRGPFWGSVGAREGED
jgi:hypothetical protein